MNAALFIGSAKFQLLALSRAPGYWVPILIFPVMLFTMFGAGAVGEQANDRMASFVVYGVIGVALFQFGVAIAQDRASNWERFRRTLPGSALPRLAAQVVSALVFSLLSSMLVIVAAILLSAPSANGYQILGLLMVSIIVAVPFSLLGIAIGYLGSAKSAVAVANLLYLPLAYLGGLWLPPAALPATIASISPFTPTRQAAELAWAAVAGRSPSLQYPLSLLLWTLFFAALAWWAYQRDERKRFR